MSQFTGGSSLSPETFEAYNVQLQTAILNPTKHAFSLPTDLAFHRSIDRDLAKELDLCSSKVMAITNNLLAFTATGNMKGKGKARLLETQEDVVDNFHSMVVDDMEQLLERTVSQAARFISNFLNCCPGYMFGQVSGACQGTCDCYEFAA
jgi:exosome complex exonuclease RRP6